MKEKPSKLDSFAARLDEWFGLEKLSLKEVQAKLQAESCPVSLSRLSSWWQHRQTQRQEEMLLAQITSGARQCKEVERAFGSSPPPELETIIKLQRVLIMKLSVMANADPDLIAMVGKLTRPCMEYAKLLEKRRELELAEAKYRDQVAQRKAAIEAEVTKAKAAGGLTPETIERIERELKLL